MKQVAFLNYTFMFEPSEAWSNLYQFEADLSKMLSAMGYDAQVIKAVEGGGQARILYIQKKGMAMPGEPAKIGRPKSIGSQFKDMSKRKLTAPARDFMAKK